MGSIIFALVLLAVAAAVFFLGRASSDKLISHGAKVAAAVLVIASGIVMVKSCFVAVSQSTVGIVTTFGSVHEKVLTEGAHFISPVSKVHEIYLAQQQAVADSEAGSRDLQSVHAKVAVNFSADPAHARELFMLNPEQNYHDLLVTPAVLESFKAVVSKYSAEELITKRQEVSDGIVRALSAKLQPFHLRVQAVNLKDFGFGKAFNAAIEEKVTASQKAETAKRNLEKVQYEVDARIRQAEGEAKAIAIQAAAVEKAGGAAYIQLQAIEKWNGALPSFVGAGAPIPFLNVK